MKNNRPYISLIFSFLVTLYFNGFQDAIAQQSEEAHPAKSLTAQASDPSAPIIQFSVTDFYSPDVNNLDNSYNYFQLQPVIPIPKLKHFPFKQIVRITFSYTNAGSDFSGVNDLNLVHMVVPDLEKWGSWSVGYTFTFPTGETPNLGSGKWQIGPAASIVYYKIKNWQFGGLFTNSFSFAGDSDSPSINMFTFQPIINRMFGKWYLGVGDFVWTYDWNTSGSLTIPLGLQAGRITKIGKSNYNISLEFEYTAKYQSESVSPVWGVKFGFVLLIPETSKSN